MIYRWLPDIYIAKGNQNEIKSVQNSVGGLLCYWQNIRYTKMKENVIVRSTYVWEMYTIANEQQIINIFFYFGQLS